MRFVLFTILFLASFHASAALKFDASGNCVDGNQSVAKERCLLAGIKQEEFNCVASTKNYCEIPKCAMLAECQAAATPKPVSTCPEGKVPHMMGCIDKPTEAVVPEHLKSPENRSDERPSTPTTTASSRAAPRAVASPSPTSSPTSSSSARPKAAATSTSSDDDDSSSGGGGKAAAAEKDDKGGTESASNNRSTPSNSSDATTAAAQQSCYNTAATADNACGGSPPSNFSSSSSSLNSSARDMMAAAQSAASANYAWARRCTAAYTQCAIYCENVDSSAVSRCESYSGKVALAGQQAQQSLDQASQAHDATYSSNTGGGGGGVATQNPNQAYGYKGGNDPTGCANNPGSPQCLLCTRDPSHPSCGGAAAPRAGFRENESTRRALDDFNTPDPGSSGGMAQYGYAAQAAAALQGRTVPNGGGGGMPGVDGSRAQLGAQARKGAAPAGSQADIFQGERGGSGWGGYGHGNSATNEFESGSGRGGMAANGQRAPSATPYDGMDLKKYLPGHGHDPRRMMGGMGGPSQDIMGRTADMFKQVSERFQERCRLGKLYDCR